MKNKKIIIPVIALVVIALGVGGFFAFKYRTTTIGEVLDLPKNETLVKVVLIGGDGNHDAYAEITDAETLEKFSEFLTYKVNHKEKNELNGCSTSVVYHYSDGTKNSFMLAGETRFKANENIYSLANDTLDTTYINSFFAE